ncbi:MAG: urease accessory protein UreF [Leptolyngbyaceae bacterium]|nr:urease accessory protein UreF [Leptolyngbyaceae bacterium]
MVWPNALLHLLQLASPSLPVGAYSYSEGLETLVHDGHITTAADLADWLRQELRHGPFGLELTVMVQAHAAMVEGDMGAIARHNHWLSALRDTEEIREQQWQMGRTLTKLLHQLEPDLAEVLATVGLPCNFAIAFSIAAAHWQIAPDAMALGYGHGWLTNLVNAGIKLIPLGQTTGQMLLVQLYPELEDRVARAIAFAPITDSREPISICNWGMALASMNHETLYSRLFRS